jgi:Polyketide cyclase / dehydrase and lipid transport
MVDVADTDSCELVAVRIERTSSNSRRIFGEITVPTPIKDVWAILTDYNRLATHVPNLVESRVERPLSVGEMGDGQYSCRLYQKGAQKIIGFEFGASVTMNMQESIRAAFPLSTNGESIGSERMINFKCVDSFFFQEFDGEWKAKERVGEDGTTVETLLSYTVDVRPKGPVPVAALEWRIREDVPTNLRAVKKSAMEVGFHGVMATRSFSNLKTATARLPGSGKRGLLKVQWYKDETMGTYLTE